MKQILAALILAFSSGSVSADWGTAILGGLKGLGEAMQESGKQGIERDNQLRLLEEQHRLEMERIEREYQLRREEQARQVELRNREREAQDRQREAQETERRIAAAKKARQEEEDRKNAINTGTGFFVSPNGYLITNAHVVRDKTTYAIRDLAGKFYRAQLVSQDSVKDLALLKIDGRFPALKVGDSTKVVKGQHVLAVGFPQISIQGNESKVTDGIISSFSGLRDHDHWFQISVPIQGGNSGGPLVTENGIVIGVVVASVNVAKFYTTTGNLPQNVNFAIKSTVLLDFLADQRITNVATSKGKTSIDAVDSATVLVIAKNGSIDVSYAVSPEQSAREERERVKKVTEEAGRRKAEEAAEKKRQYETARVVKRDLAVQKAFPDWREIRESDVFAEWLRQQSDDSSKKVDSPEASDVISVFRRFQIERPGFAEKYFERFGAWIADVNGCKFFNPKPEPAESVTWNGKCEQGRGYGEGELVWLRNGEPQQKMRGHFRDGMLNGAGTREIIGKFYDEGNYKNGKLEGKGKVSFSLGGRYEGHFKAGKPEGQGKQIFKDGGIYEGNFNSGKLEGRGKLFYTNGDIYEGSFAEGKPSGQGTLSFKSGTRYEGYFSSGKPEGKGKMFLPSGETYEGEFRDGKGNGQGKLTFKGGEYEGGFKDNKFDGQGKLSKDGGYYEGNFKDGIPDGKGTVVDRDGKSKSVEFAAGKQVR
jgi:S1-C subfamily serine protease